jgi:hypothetical protein
MWVTLARGGRWLFLAVVLSLGLMGCGSRAHEPVNTPSSSAQLPSALPASPSTGTTAPSALPVDVDYSSASVIKMRARRPTGLSVRRFVLAGSWQMRDYTDNVCALEYNTLKPVYPQCKTFLVDLATGRKRLALGDPVNAAAQYEILGVKMSAHWLAWEEVSPGDDLAQTVRWALYVARFDPHTFAVGRPTLVDSSKTSAQGRPLFDFAGDTLCWMGNVYGARPGGRVWAVDLPSHRPRLIYKTSNRIGTVNASDARVIVTESYHREPLAQVLTVVDLRTRRQLERVRLGAGNQVAHFPSVRNGALAWAVFSDDHPDAVYPTLYLRDPQGRSYLVAYAGHDPSLVGHWLFFVQNPTEGAYGTRRWMAEVDAVDCRTGVGYTLAKGEVEGGDNWFGGFGAPATAHTFVAYNDKAILAESSKDKVTVIDVYRVR